MGEAFKFILLNNIIQFYSIVSLAVARAMADVPAVPSGTDLSYEVTSWTVRPELCRAGARGSGLIAKRLADALFDFPSSFSIFLAHRSRNEVAYFT